MRSVSLLLLLPLCLGLASPLVASDLIPGVQVGKTGSVKAGELGLSLIHFAPEWQLTTHGQGVKLDKDQPTATPGSWSAEGRFESKSGVMAYEQQIKKTGPHSVRCSYRLRSKEGAPTNAVAVSISIPTALFAGSELQADGKGYLLPEDETKGGIRFAREARRIVIPTTSGRLVLEGDPLHLHLQDDRQYGATHYSLRLNMPTPENLIKDAQLNFTLTLEPYAVETIDLRHAANMGFADDVDGDKIGGWTDQGSRNDLRAMKPGKRPVGSVTFDIIDPAQNGGKSCLVFAGPSRDYLLKQAEVAMKGRAAKYLYLLHASAWTPAKDTPVGEISVVYSDGTTSNRPVVAGVDVGNWWGASGLKNGAVAWTAENESAYVGLFQSCIELDGKPIDRLRLSSTGKGVWMMVGMSTSEERVPLPRTEPTYLIAGGDWKPIEHHIDIEPGSILDLSGLVETPAGRHGPIVARGGHLEYADAPGKRVRLVGANLCFSANFLERQEADKLATRFRAMGYNTVRFHHYDRDLIGGWNVKRSDTIDPKMLDRLDYMFHAMKQAGQYVSIDLYTIRGFEADEIPSWGKPVGGEIKALVPILPDAFAAWSKMALALLNHVNPYTGLAWKDDPAFFSICPLNEDSILNVWGGHPDVKALYLQKFDAWLKEAGRTPANEEERQSLLMQFLIEVKMKSNAQLAEFFKDNGVRALITGSNFVDKQIQTFTREQFDLVDNHQYWDHPGFPEKAWSLPHSYQQGSALRSAAHLPRSMMPTRVFGKPFTVTEWNYCAPNVHRAEGSPLMGAYAALQDWDGLYRFAWSHNADNLVKPTKIGGFDIATDPLNLLGERLVVLLFGRGDVSPATTRSVYAVTMDDATRDGMGWIEGNFPEAFSTVGLVHQIGSQTVAPDRPLREKFDKAAARVTIDEALLAGSSFMTPEALQETAQADGKTVRSETGELEIDTANGTFRIVTPRSECLTVLEGGELAGKLLSVANAADVCTVSASAVDDKSLSTSGRILLLHLTDVGNTKMRFQDKQMRVLEDYGVLPHLVRRGRATITLKSGRPDLTLWAVELSGKRIEKVDATYADGAYTFTLETAPAKGPSRMAYELVAENGAGNP